MWRVLVARKRGDRCQVEVLSHSMETWWTLLAGLPGSSMDKPQQTLQRPVQLCPPAWC